MLEKAKGGNVFRPFWGTEEQITNQEEMIVWTRWATNTKEPL